MSQPTFIEVDFPLPPSFGVQSDGDFSVTVIELANGFERRNLNWTQRRRTFTVTIGPREQELQEMLRDFHEAVGGTATGFRFKDYADFKTCRISRDAAFNDQVIGVGDGVQTVFQLTKTSSAGIGPGSLSRVRPLRKPLAETVLVGVAGAELDSGWSMDATTGLITFDAAPALAAQITAGCEFDTPVRFNSSLTSTIDDRLAVTVSVSMIEIRV